MPLNSRELLELPDLALETASHLVEAGRELGHVVAAAHDHSLGQPTSRELIGDLCGHPHRCDHLPGY